MEKDGFGRSPAGAGRTAGTVRHAVRAIAAIAVASLAIAAPAFAGDPACRSSRSAFSARSRLETLPRRLREHGPVRILAIGSSSTEGIGASSPAFSYPAQLQADLNEVWEGRVIVDNAGKGGETIVETIDRLETALKTDEPDLVIWQVGTNDAVKGGDERRFSELLARGIDAAQAAGVDLILLDQQYYPAIRDLARYERFVRHVRVAAARERVPLFSRYTLMREWAEPPRNVLGAMLSADGFHMGDRGYDCMARLVAEGIRSMVDSRNGVPGPGPDRRPSAGGRLPSDGSAAKARTAGRALVGAGPMARDIQGISAPSQDHER
jgi:lysophospholipase L1-like esterase